MDRKSRRERIAEKNRVLEQQAQRSRRVGVGFLLLVLAAGTLMVNRNRQESASAEDTAAANASMASTEEITAAAVDTEPASEPETAAFLQSEEPAAKAATEEETDGAGESSSFASSEEEEPDYDICLDSAMGPLFYYNQTDERWSDYLWGGTDDLAAYGCGPTSMAMIVNSFGSQSEQVTPITMAKYCYQEGLFSQGHGSYHQIVEDVLSEYGFAVTSLQDDQTVSAVQQALRKGHLVVALMGPGHFTDSGHYLVITSENDDGTWNVADTKSLENTMQSFEPEDILSELHNARDAGAPLWEVASTAN
jgi:hypothetical protein